jgi:hypothetical protein
MCQLTIFALFSGDSDVLYACIQYMGRNDDLSRIMLLKGLERYAASRDRADTTSPPIGLHCSRRRGCSSDDHITLSMAAAGLERPPGLIFIIFVLLIFMIVLFVFLLFFICIFLFAFFYFHPNGRLVCFSGASGFQASFLCSPLLGAAISWHGQWEPKEAVCRTGGQWQARGRPGGGDGIE